MVDLLENDAEFHALGSMEALKISFNIKRGFAGVEVDSITKLF